MVSIHATVSTAPVVPVDPRVRVLAPATALVLRTALIGRSPAPAVRVEGSGLPFAGPAWGPPD